MRRFIKHLYHNTTLGKRFLYPIKKLDEYISPRLLPEKTYIRRTFKNTFGYNLNLTNPKSFNEKILWLQQNNRMPLHTICTDKYAVREYIKEKIGEQYLIPLVYHTDDPANIIPENLPDYPFIIKTNHGCGGHVIVKDKSIIDWERTQKTLAKLLKINYYYKHREWQYKNIKPCVIVEKLLLDENSNIPYDHKIECFNGKVAYINVIEHRFLGKNFRVYDPYWKSINCLSSDPDGKDIMKPSLLDEMKKLAEVIAKDFIYVRVDMYYLAGKIFFGELTFSPAAGFDVFNPHYWDRKFGDELKLC